MINILLICGGKSRERDISLNSVRSVYDHIKGLDAFSVSVLFFNIDGKKYVIDEGYLYSNTSDDFRFLLQSIEPLNEDSYSDYLQSFDLIFPIIHGVGGEDGEIQAFLETHNIPFVGSPSSACRKMYNKKNANKLIIESQKMFNIPKLFISQDNFDELAIKDFIDQNGESVIKPVEGGSSYGVKFVDKSVNYCVIAKKLLQEYGQIVVEKKCIGKEFTIIILQNGEHPVALIPTEIEIEGQFDTRRKYMSTTEVKYHCPARFDSEYISKIRSRAEELFTFVGARDFLRIDGWLFPDGNIYFSDFNPISGMEQNSFIFQQTTKIGFTHGTAIEYILKNACNRYGLTYSSSDNASASKRRVNVLFGGTTSERQVSLLSGTNVWLKLMRSEKYAPVPYIMTEQNNEYMVHEIPYSLALLHTTEEIISQIDNNTIDKNLVSTIRERLNLPRQDISNSASWMSLNSFAEMSKSQDAYVFIGLHGGFGENGGIQSLFDDYGLSYNGSGAEASNLCMNKYRTGENVTSLGLPGLRTCKKILGKTESISWAALSEKLGNVIIAKPNGDGCSTGVVKLCGEEDFLKYLDYCKSVKPIPAETFTNQMNTINMPQEFSEILFEEFISVDKIQISKGELLYSSETGWIEITIGVLEKFGNYHALNPSVTIAEGDILSVEEKFQSGRGVNLTPPRNDMMSNSFRRYIQYLAERVAENCNVEDYCRIDMFINNKTGEVVVIEINTLPGLSPSTVLFQQAAKETPLLSPLALLEFIIDSEGDDKLDKLTFKEMLECTSGTTDYIGDDFSVSGVSFDTRGSIKNMAFIAFETDKNDGHKYVKIAESKGAVALIVSKDVETNLPCIKVQDTKKAYQDIAHYFRKKFSIPVVAITGSNGKTTVKDMLSSVLSAKYKVLATEKNLNNELGVPQTLLKLNDSYEAAVIELGMNHQGEISATSKIAEPTVAVITKIGTAHMGNLGGNRQGVFDAKMEITDGLKAGGSLILSGDDDMLAEVKLNAVDVVFSGLNNDGKNMIYASDIRQYWDNSNFGLKFNAHYQDKEYSCALPVLGKHNVQNALLALTVGIKLNVPIEDAINALRIYPRSSMRLETSTINGIRFIKDYYNASPDSMKSALDTLNQLQCDGKKIAILGEMLELGNASFDLHKEISDYSIGKADVLYFVGSSKDAISFARSDAKCFVNKEELNFALSSAILSGELSFGDIVLIKGSNGIKMWEQYEFLHKLLEQGSIISAQTRLLVDVDALKYNYAAIKQYVGNNVQVMPVIKADAYGAGANLLANIYNDCSFFAVADLSEVDELHSMMPSAKFLVLYQSFSEETDKIAERADYIVMSVGDVEYVKTLNKSARKANKIVTVHIEVDTGMGRLGVLLDDCEELANVLSKCENLAVDGIFTHYSSADMYDDESLEYTAMQTEKFKKAITIVESILGKIHYKHACAGAAIFNPNAELFNMVRPGYILRGYYPCVEIKDKITLKPALKYVTQVTQIKEFAAGESVSYGRHFTTERKTRLAEIPVGYSDGVMRKLSNIGAFVINGQLAPIVGNVTMDYTMVDVTDIKPMVWVGDEVAIFDNVNMTVEKMAELCETIGYEILTNIKDKADRIEVF